MLKLYAWIHLFMLDMLTCTYPRQSLVASTYGLLDAISVGFASCLVKGGKLE